MLNFIDIGFHLDVKATDNLKMSVKPGARSDCRGPPQLAGAKLTTFVPVSAAKEVERILRDHQATTLLE